MRLHPLLVPSILLFGLSGCTQNAPSQSDDFLSDKSVPAERSRPNNLIQRSPDPEAPREPVILLDRRYVYPRSALDPSVEDSFVAPEHGNLTFRLTVYRDCAGLGFYENVGLEVEKPDGQRETYRQGSGGDSLTPTIYECQGPPEPRETREATVPSLEGDWPFRGIGECTCSLHVVVLAAPV